MSLIGTPQEQSVAGAWLESMDDVLKVEQQNQIPELNEYQCGTYNMHSLDEAKAIAENIRQRGVGVNSNDELKLDPEFLQSHS